MAHSIRCFYLVENYKFIFISVYVSKNRKVCFQKAEFNLEEKTDITRNMLHMQMLRTRR